MPAIGNGSDILPWGGGSPRLHFRAFAGFVVGLDRRRVPCLARRAPRTKRGQLGAGSMTVDGVDGPGNRGGLGRGSAGQKAGGASADGNATPSMRATDGAIARMSIVPRSPWRANAGPSLNRLDRMAGSLGR